ncbi:MAG: hypothetical protein KGI67_02395 [Pseudomonadota bacterium]|nr:hypothetical protein [Pseudomonadota bacterium]
MSGALSVALLRRLVADAPWAQDRLRPFAGQQIAWNLAGMAGTARIDDDGLPDTAAGAEPPAGARSGVRVTLAAEDLATAAQGFDALMRCVTIEGNAGLASELGHIARHLRPDPADWLTPWLGNILAERASQGLRGGVAWALQAGGRAARAGADFAVHEARLLPAPEAAGAQGAALTALREDTERLAARIARLERSLAR